MGWDNLKFWDVWFHFGEESKMVSNVQRVDMDYVDFINMAIGVLFPHLQDDISVHYAITYLDPRWNMMCEVRNDYELMDMFFKYKERKEIDVYVEPVMEAVSEEDNNEYESEELVYQCSSEEDVNEGDVNEGGANEGDVNEVDNGNGGAIVVVPIVTAVEDDDETQADLLCGEHAHDDNNNKKGDDGEFVSDANEQG